MRIKYEELVTISILEGPDTQSFLRGRSQHEIIFKGAHARRKPVKNGNEWAVLKLKIESWQKERELMTPKYFNQPIINKLTRRYRYYSRKNEEEPEMIYKGSWLDYIH